MGEAESVDVAVAEEEHARDESPDQGDGREHRIGQVSEGEDNRGDDDWHDFAGDQPQQTKEEVALQEKLLHQGPYDVGPAVQWQREGSVQAMQGVSPRGNQDRKTGEQESGSDDPEGLEESLAAEAEPGPSFTASQ